MGARTTRKVPPQAWDLPVEHQRMYRDRRSIPKIPRSLRLGLARMMRPLSTYCDPCPCVDEVVEISIHCLCTPGCAATVSYGAHCILQHHVVFQLCITRATPLTVPANSFDTLLISQSKTQHHRLFIGNGFTRDQRIGIMTM